MADAKARIVKTYESSRFNEAMEESLHPGGLDITERMIEEARIGADMLVLDLACGRGTSSCFIARTTGCRVVGVDLSDKSLAFARKRAALQHLSHLVEFRRADIESLPFSDASFDAVVSECSFSLQREKETVTAEMTRVLKPDGVLCMSDVFLRHPLTADLAAEAPFDCCFTNAKTIQTYEDLFGARGFELAIFEDHSLSMTVDTTLKLIKHYGSLADFWNSFGSGDCALCGAVGERRDGDCGGAYWKALFRQADPGYCIMIWRKAVSPHPPEGMRE